MARLMLGLMTGTSLDGLDLALLDPESLECPGWAVIAFPPDLKHALQALTRGDPVRLADLGATETRYSGWMAECAADFLRTQGLDTRDVLGIACHGQTLHHAPSAEAPFTFQLVNPGLIAAELALPVVSDFRRTDVALGGQGAPLVPPFHQALFGRPGKRVAVVNIGGIANVTLCGPDASDLQGYDTGPGNGLLDEWCAATWNESQDAGGQRAARGQVCPDLLGALLEEDYFSTPPPKSTGREYFNLDWLRRRAGDRLKKLAPENVLATLTHLTARTIADAVARSDEVILCGGGIHNTTLVSLIRAYSAATVMTTDERGVPADALEAMAFAWLGWRALTGQTTAWAAVTGASRDSVSAGLWGLEFLRDPLPGHAGA